MSVTAERISIRDAILDACDRIMARIGFRKMNMEDLAKEAGVSRRTIYLHFESKEDVGLSSIGRVVQAVHDELRAIHAESLKPAEKLRRMLMARVMGRIHAVKDYYDSLDELFEVVRPAYMARRRMYFEAEAAMIAEVLAEGKAAGALILPGLPKETARSLLLATNAFLPYSLSVRELGEPLEIERNLGAMVELLLRGLVKNPPGETRT